MIYTTNPIESSNSQIRKLNKSRVVFPNDEALFKGGISSGNGSYQEVDEQDKRLTPYNSGIGCLL